MKNQLKLFITLTAATSFSAAFLLFGGCEDAEEAFDCASICKAYDDCVDDDIDLAECTDSCEDNADQSEDFAERVEGCEDCIEDKACSEKVFQCSSECVGIVPPNGS